MYKQEVDDTLLVAKLALKVEQLCDVIWNIDFCYAEFFLQNCASKNSKTLKYICNLIRH